VTPARRVGRTCLALAVCGALAATGCDDGAGAPERGTAAPVPSTTTPDRASTPTAPPSSPAPDDAATTTPAAPTAPRTAPPDGITAAVETEPADHDGDAADDPAIWVHPTDPSASTIIGTDKQGALEVYALSGERLFRYEDGPLNNVDLRYDFPLGGRSVDLVAATDRERDALRLYTVDPASGALEPAGTAPVADDVYGVCLYRSARGGYYAFTTDMDGGVQQWELADDGAGGVRATEVRTLTLSSVSEGCVADDAGGALYVAEESTGIWRFDAEPGGGTDATAIDRVGPSLTADVEGLAIYATAEGGYLIASSQGDDRYAVYDLAAPDGALTTFRIDGDDVDEVTHTDGLDVTSAALGDRFPHGVLVVQDDDNDDGNQNFKLVPWERVATGTPVPLTIAPSWDPRRPGG
jgi:3-phytase